MKFNIGFFELYVVIGVKEKVIGILILYFDI